MRGWWSAPLSRSSAWHVKAASTMLSRMEARKPSVAAATRAMARHRDQWLVQLQGCALLALLPASCGCMGHLPDAIGDDAAEDDVERAISKQLAVPDLLPLHALAPEDVAAWLRRQDLPGDVDGLCAAVIKRKINGATLRDADDASLRELGVTTLGLRKAVLKLLRAEPPAPRRADEPPPPPPPPPLPPPPPPPPHPHPHPHPRRCRWCRRRPSPPLRCTCPPSPAPAPPSS